MRLSRAAHILGMPRQVELHMVVAGLGEDFPRYHLRDAGVEHMTAVLTAY